jgi:hypothetical protein
MLVAMILGFASCATPSGTSEVSKDAKKTEVSAKKDDTKKNKEVVGKAKSNDKKSAPAAKQQSSAVAATKASSNLAICNSGSVERQVALVYTAENSKLPCKVTYTKKTEEPGKVEDLWSAEHQEGFCEEKMNSLVSKLEGMGFSCNRQAH